jgi:hypothetical protein
LTPVVIRKVYVTLKLVAKKDNYLFIPDYHAPFGHKRALSFCVSLQDEFDIPQKNIYCAGDFEDQYNFGRWPKDPNRAHTHIQEIEATRHEVKEWGKAFPLMKMLTSNHGTRIGKKAFEAELPSQLLRSHHEIFEYPKGWELAEEYVVIATKHEFVLQHGDGFSGVKGHIDAAIANGMSTAIGHLHSFAGVSHIRTKHQHIWAANAGCLIDQSAYAFEYAKHSKFKATIGALVILDGGRWPIWVPLE